SIHLTCSSARIYLSLLFPFFLYTVTPTTEIYTLSLHDALPISKAGISPTSWPIFSMFQTARRDGSSSPWRRGHPRKRSDCAGDPDRKSTRLNSSHVSISYAVFCLKKKKKNNI